MQDAASESVSMVYVAEDPEQPGAAWGITAIDPKYAKDTAKTIADWVRRGATIQCVTHEVGMAMILRWVRPEKKRRATGTQQLEL